jgi:putative FmdB family regulatory protein
MPVYDYRCGECNHVFTKMKPIDERRTDTCPECKSDAKQVILKTAALPIGKMGCDPAFPTAWDKWEKRQRSKAKEGGQWDSNNERYGGYHEK